MIVCPCHVCRTQLSAEAGQGGPARPVPVVPDDARVPAEQFAAAGRAGGRGARAAAAARAAAVRRRAGSRAAAARCAGAGDGPPTGKRYGFNCGYCSSRLEATESMAAQEGQCPTCGNNITIPILDRYGRLIDPKTRQIIKQDPHPVHAYAAAGDRAPADPARQGRQAAHQVPPLRRHQPDRAANNCKGCGMPFTMEGTTLEAAGTSNGFCVASLVLGIIGLPAACGDPPVLAVVFGIIGYNQVTKGGEGGGGGKGMAIAGIVCGSIGC